MTRSILASLAFVLLLLLTLTTWLVAESPWVLSLVAIAKVSAIGWVFLELRHSRPVWPLVFVTATATVLIASAGLIASAT
jgi:hypothetical protein